MKHKVPAPWKCEQCGATLDTFDQPCVPNPQPKSDGASSSATNQKGANDE